ncbi:BLOC-1-related complex subunit 8-like isoform X2 [Patiria miniata]|uniref:BLOC-1-related complex subunit 8 n=1 Tax=Patiria miniata TaxID=46514 RepID=A0A914B5G5_PATMI|nr:BLOC-1-related complex subunit 8-like isoform X2 [Patiria miniata]
MDSFGSQALLHASINRSSDSGDPEVEYRVKKVTEKFSECMHIVANEPSLAMFRIQEHIRKSLPKLAECKMELGQTQQLVQGAYYDVDYAIRAVSDIQNSTQSFASIENMLKDSITCKRQLNAKAQAAKAVKARDSPLTLIKDETGETASTGSNT